jgi:PucR-like helix-turn-helix protein
VLASTRFSVAESARILHCHCHAMRYRVTKLERMLGGFTGDATAALRIGAALHILRMYEVSGDTLQTPRADQPGRGSCAAAVSSSAIHRPRCSWVLKQASNELRARATICCPLRFISLRAAAKLASI